MTHVYFHCSSNEGVVLDRRGSDLDDLIDAREHAERFIRSLIARPGPEDWRDWLLHVSDDEGDEVLVVEFASFFSQRN